MNERPAVNLPAELADNLGRAWANLAGPGAVWTGAERLAIATEARRARDGRVSQSDLPAPAAEAARLLAADPAAARRSWVDGLVADGLDESHYVELLGVVSRLAAIDTVHEALGWPLAPVPEPGTGKPTGAVSDQARAGKAWVSMVGGTSITQALSLVPSENEELEQFHGSTYLLFEEMGDPHVTRGLTRPQMELVASRTSTLNECFY